MTYPGESPTPSVSAPLVPLALNATTATVYAQVPVPTVASPGISPFEGGSMNLRISLDRITALAVLLSGLLL